MNARFVEIQIRTKCEMARRNSFSRRGKVFRPAQTLSHATTKCFVPPKHFLTPRQSVSSRPNTFSRHDKVFRPAQSLSRATTKCFVLPNHFLVSRESVWSRSFSQTWLAGYVCQ